MNTDERVCAIALTLCPGVGSVGAKRLITALGSARAVFERRRELPRLVPHVSAQLVQALADDTLWRRAETEMEFVEKNRVTCLTLTQADYPVRLLDCADAPAVLFYKGQARLSASRVVSVVGTRRPGSYGVDFCQRFVADLSALVPDVLVVSGLAYGIDICAHRAALARQVATVAVLAHGLDRIYPAAHRQTAVDMLERGGLLTEYLSGTTPDAFHFVSRNRIVAGLSDAVLVVESAEKGGSMITLELADSYHRDCFAVPGRVNDALSMGCNQLIRDRKAELITCAEDLVRSMGWLPENREKPVEAQGDLFPLLSDDEQRLASLLRREGDLQVNTLVGLSGLPYSKVSALLFRLELKGLVRSLAGGRYHLLA